MKRFNLPILFALVKNCYFVIANYFMSQNLLRVGEFYRGQEGILEKSIKVINSIGQSLAKKCITSNFVS